MDFKQLIDANGHAEIPEGTEKINQRAFKECKTLVSVTIPSSVTIIQRNAFEQCESLTSITIPDSVEMIGPNCFKNCNNLTEVSLPKGIRIIDDGLFYGCKSLKEIVIPEPSSLKTIGPNAFAECKSLESIVIPPSVTKIGEGAFRDSGIKEFEIPETVKEIDSGAFRDCSSLMTIRLPAKMDKIGSYAFAYCSSLKEIVIPEKVKEIDSGAFRSCSSLMTIRLSAKMDKIGYYAFADCSSLKEIVIPETVKEIDSGAFRSCSSLRTIRLPAKMDKIGDYAFADCPSLEEIDIPEGITEIPQNAFTGCQSVHIHLSSTVSRIIPSWEILNPKEITISADNKSLSLENDCIVDLSNRSLIAMLPSATAFPEGIRAILLNEDIFAKVYDVEVLVIPDGVIHIDRLPFRNMTKLKKLQLPASMKSCGEFFMHNYPLSSISVSPELFLSEQFKAWQDINKVNLIGIESVSRDLLEKIRAKYQNQKREYGEKLFWVYLNDQLIYPAAHIVKKKQEAIEALQKEIEAQKQKEEEEELNRQKKEMTDKLEDVTISSLCAATFGGNGFEFKYVEKDNTVKVTVFDEVRIVYSIHFDNVQNDLAFLLDVAATYRNAIKPYIEGVPSPCAKNWHRGNGYFVCGQPFPDTEYYLGVQADTLNIAFQALEDLSKAYKDLSGKYGQKFNDISY